MGCIFILLFLADMYFFFFNNFKVVLYKRNGFHYLVFNNEMVMCMVFLHNSLSYLKLVCIF
jgi:hypothetical protein